VIEAGKPSSSALSSAAGSPVSSLTGAGSILAPWRKPVFIVFLVLLAWNEAVLWLRIEPAPWGGWGEGMLLLAAAGCSLVSLGQRLPLQNVLMAGIAVFCLSGLLLAVGAVTGVPFGPFVYGDKLGGRLFGTVPWTLPVLWIVLLVNGRGVSRLIMRPWRKTNYYGYWVIGLTGLLAVHFDLGLQPFAVKVKQYWLWRPTNTWLKWYGAPWVNFLGCLVGATLILALTLPWLINKQPVKRPRDYQPLLVWLALHLWLATGNATHACGLAAGTGLAGCVLIGYFAIRGARW
jgi:uncharacterized membrane protein